MDNTKSLVNQLNFKANNIALKDGGKLNPLKFVIQFDHAEVITTSQNKYI